MQILSTAMVIQNVLLEVTSRWTLPNSRCGWNSIICGGSPWRYDSMQAEVVSIHTFDLIHWTIIGNRNTIYVYNACVVSIRKVSMRLLIKTNISHDNELYNAIFITLSLFLYFYKPSSIFQYSFLLIWNFGDTLTLQFIFINTEMCRATSILIPDIYFNI